MTSEKHSEKIKTLCRLEDGSLYEYDIAMRIEFAEKNPSIFHDTNSKYLYLGKGYVVITDGVVQSPIFQDHFWKKK